MSIKPTDNISTEILDKVYNEGVQTLEELIKIPSVSVNATESDLANIQKSADYLTELFSAEGLRISQASANKSDGTVGNVALIGYRGASEDGSIDSSKPTVLLYAHHDVQPSNPETWATDPYTPVYKTCSDGERLFGRGSADDGAGIILHLSILRYYNQLIESGKIKNFPINIKIFIEGEEENGSPSFANFIKKYQDELNADVIIVADSGNWAVGTPAITTTLRGVATIELDLQILKHPVHSGMYSGPIIDANSLLMMTISSIWDKDGNIVVAGLKQEDNEPEIDYTFDDFKKDSGLLDGVELAGSGKISGRLWNKPTVTVIGFDATKVDQSSNVLANKARARLSLRVPPSQTPKEAADALISHLQTNVPFNAKFDAKILETGPGFKADITSNSAQKLANALTEGFQKDVVYSGMGGSIPFTADLSETFPGAEILLVGVEDPDSRAHSDDESVNLGDLKKVIHSGVLLVENLAK